MAGKSFLAGSVLCFAGIVGVDDIYSTKTDYNCDEPPDEDVDDLEEEDEEIVSEKPIIAATPIIEDSFFTVNKPLVVEEPFEEEVKSGIDRNDLQLDIAPLIGERDLEHGDLNSEEPMADYDET